MNPIQELSVLPAINPGVIKNNAAWTSNVIDTAQAGGAKSLNYIVHIGSIDADMASLKVQQADAITNATTLNGGVDVPNVTLTPLSTDDNKLFLLTVNLQGNHKRYMQLQGNAGNGVSGTYLSAIAAFEYPGVVPPNAGFAAIASG